MVVGHTSDGKVRVVLDGSSKEHSLKTAHVLVDRGSSKTTKRTTSETARGMVVDDTVAKTSKRAVSENAQTLAASESELATTIDRAACEEAGITMLSAPVVGSRVSLLGHERATQRQLQLN